jgi:hypothetical protein
MSEPTATILGTIELHGRRFDIMKTVFSNGRVAVLLERDGVPYSRLAVNLPQEEIQNDEFFASTYEENAELREPLLASGLFKDTGRRAKSALVELELWKLTSCATLH